MQRLQNVEDRFIERLYWVKTEDHLVQRSFSNSSPKSPNKRLTDPDGILQRTLTELRREKAVKLLTALCELLFQTASAQDWRVAIHSLIMSYELKNMSWIWP